MPTADALPPTGIRELAPHPEKYDMPGKRARTARVPLVNL
jgi:hypothetical protein